MKRKASAISMSKRRLATGVVAACLALLQQLAAAEDLDLFIQPPGSADAVPNVLIVLDNTANWTTPFTNELAALVETVNGLPVNDDGSAIFRVGLMLFTETGSPNNNIDGGYIRAAVRDLNATNKPLYVDLVESLHITNDKSNSGKAGKTMMEAYYYFAGQNPRSGNNKVKTDYTGNNVGGPASTAIYDLPENALPQRDGSRASGPPYNSPVIEGNCGQNFIIYISNGPVQDTTSDTVTARDGLQTEGGDTSTIPISPSGSMSNLADEWARFMEQSPYAITTYTVDIDKQTTGQGPGWTALLKSMAGVSRGKYFDVDSSGAGQEILEALQIIFSEIQAVNTVFASVSLPVSVNTEGTYLNQIYVGMFRPDRDALPRWMGNLKQYKLGIGNGRLETQDADSRSAINTSTGFITDCARSFWTPTTTDTYWAFSPQGSCLPIAGSKNSNYPDGNVVEKGAQAYKLRAPVGPRSPFKTCADASCSTLDDFDVDNLYVSEAALGAGLVERVQLILWANGFDIDDENVNGQTGQRRPSFHGDIIHSRPVAINMGTDASPEIVVFYGGNDGVLRAVNGNRAGNIGSVPAGNEMWAFIGPEFYGHIKRLRDNSTPISFYGNTFASSLPKPYGFDGPIIAYHEGSDLWIYSLLRRGGRGMYAFDVSTIDTSPSSPTLKWRKGCPNLTDDTGCTTGFEEIGQTWSAPQVMKAAGYNDGDATSPTPLPLLIMGGGYDPCEDDDPDSCGATPKGNRVYLLDADTGDIVNTFITDRGVVSDVVVVKDEATGLARWAYAADMGGNIYRIGSGPGTNAEFADTDPDDWTMTKIASLGCSTASTGCDGNRKFMMPLDVVEDRDGSFVILAGTGDREKPLQGFGSAYGVSNFFFKIVDRPTQTDWLTSENGTCFTDLICVDSLLTIGASNPAPNDLLAHPKGWQLELASHEQVVTSAITVFGTTTFSTHTPVVPTAGGCASNLGTAKVYNISYENAASRNGTLARSEVIVGGGLPPSPVAGMVTLDDGTVMPFLIGGDPNSALQGMEPVPSGLAEQAKSLTYWNIHK